MTYSIVAIDEKTKTLGVAVASGSIAVGTRVPWVKEHIGAIATQAYTNTMYGSKGLELLAKDYSPSEALEKLLNLDPERDYRQVAIIDAGNRKAVFTGEKCPDWKGQIIGDNYVIIGNLIVGENVLKAVENVFNESLGPFPLRLLNALIAGEKEGGDRRGNRSAAIIVKGEYNVDIRVDNARNPTQKLLSIYESRYV